MTGSPLAFTIDARDPGSAARAGRVTTPNGTFETPAFMPVGTRGTVKGILPALLQETGAQICLANTFHLLLRPGPDLVQSLGGLHPFMGWPRPILTDSGGYQAYSMADLNAVDDDGVTFKSIIDGSQVRLTPERATQVQNALGADIIMAFDDCPPSESAGVGNAGQSEIASNPHPPTTDPRLARVSKRDRVRSVDDHAQRLRIANERTIRWLERCKAAHARPHDQALFGIVQGGTDLDARTWSAQRVTGVDLPGYAIGGVAVGEGFAQIVRVCTHTAPLLPQYKPRYLMGVGYERDLLAAVLSGVDMFDCVLPSRNGRNASAFTPTGAIRLRNAQYASDSGPLDPTCDCRACAKGPDGTGPFSRAYLRHLFMAEEMLGPILVTLHNLRHFQRFMAAVRETIRAAGASGRGASGAGAANWEGLVKRFPVAREGLSALSGS